MYVGNVIAKQESKKLIKIIFLRGSGLFLFLWYVNECQ